MAFKTIKLPLLFLLFSLSFFFASLSLAVADEEPAVKRCKEVCRIIERYSHQEGQKCREMCERKLREDGESECEEEGREVGDVWAIVNDGKQLRQCQQQCQRIQDRHMRRLCRERCEERYGRREEGEKEREGGSQDNDEKEPEKEEETRREMEKEKEKEREEKGEERERGQEGRETTEREEKGREGKGWPYLFGERDYTLEIKTKEGRIRMLRSFIGVSKLLSVVKRYRVATLVTNPRTFVVPTHWDAEGLFFVAEGQATVTIIHENRRESFSVKEGDIFHLPAGTTFYIINHSETRKLRVAILFQSVGAPGQVQAFFGPGGKDPISFYSAFSIELLEAALNIGEDTLNELFGKKVDGAIVKASKEQVQSMTHHEEGGMWPFGEHSRRAFNLFDQRPSKSNKYGKLFEVDSDRYEPLANLNIAISVANISQGGMAGPYYLSSATKISIVIRGKGYFEMACPHLPSSREEQEHGGGQRQPQTPSYEKVSGDLSEGSVLVTPVAHPVAMVNTGTESLLVVCFEINARGNEKYPLAGKNNVVSLLEMVAKELSFSNRGTVVDNAFSKQKNDYFFKAPQKEMQGHADA